MSRVGIIDSVLTGKRKLKVKNILNKLYKPVNMIHLKNDIKV